MDRDFAASHLVLQAKFNKSSDTPNAGSWKAFFSRAATHDETVAVGARRTSMMMVARREPVQLSSVVETDCLAWIWSCTGILAVTFIGHSARICWNHVVAANQWSCPAGCWMHGPFCRHVASFAAGLLLLQFVKSEQSANE